MAGLPSDALQDLESRLQSLSAGLREAVDLSLAIVAADPGRRVRVARLWEEFLGTFYGHVRLRSRATGHNLLGWVSFARIAGQRR